MERYRYLTLAVYAIAIILVMAALGFACAQTFWYGG